MNQLSSYIIQPAGAMRSHPGLIPDQPGLYALLLDHPEALEPALDRARLRLQPVNLGRRTVLYIGATDDSLRRRLKCHLSNDTGRSTFRMSLGAVLADELGLVARPGPNRSYFSFELESELALSDWIAAHVSVAVKPAQGARAQEPELIRTTKPMLNLASREPSVETGVMLMLRRRCQGLTFEPGCLN